MENEASDKKNKTEKDGADEPGNLSVFVPGVSSTASIGDVYTESVSQTDEPPDPRNRDAFQQWLETKPREWSVVIAARAALRVLPLARTVQFGSEEARAILFPVFRANATARFAAMYPNLADGALTVAKFAELTAKMAAGAVPTADESPVAAAIAARAAARAAAADAARDAAYEAAYAAYAAADAADPEDDDACTAIRQDALDLKGGTPPDRLARAALWPTGAAELVFPSGNIGGHWSLLQNDLQRLGQHWDVWTGWYDEVLVGQPRSPARSEEWEAAFTDAHGSSHPWTAPLPWDDGPEAVNLAIKARLDTERQPRPRQAVESQLDEPTADDQLYRKPFAQALVERLDKLYSEHGRSQDMESNGFAAHIHAPWGAGKTSVLKMMRQLMIASDRKAPDGRIAPRWVVVDFNAWEHERRNPPWWPLIEQVKKECLKSLSDPKGRFAAFQLRARWIWWRSKTDFLPYLVAGFVALLCLWVFWEARSGTPPVGYSIGIGHTTSSNPGPNTAIIEWVIKLSAVIIAVFTAFLGASRFMAFGSTAAAQLFESISHDPLHRVTKLFRTIVEKTGMPVCVFVDDLDRCRVPYVVELLGGIQTLFRHSRIFYVVAADRGWIKASFESSYDTFGKSVGNAGQPLSFSRKGVSTFHSAARYRWGEAGGISQATLRWTPSRSRQHV